MIDINKHPIWEGNSTWGKIHPAKKPFHLLRFFIAKQYAKLFPRSLFIGITGSVGKTTTANACVAVLREKFNVLSTTPSFDTILNIPITILKIRSNTEKVVLEMGIEYKGEMEYFLQFVAPTVGIVTKISYQHSEFLGDLEQIGDEKGQLLEQLPEDGFAILNYDDLPTRKLASKTKAEVIYYGTDQKHCNVWADKIQIKDLTTSFQLNYGVERVEINSRLLGFHQVYPLLAAACLGISTGLSLTTIKKGLEKVEPESHRMEVFEGFNGSIIIDDTYNAAFTAVEEALETLNRISARRRIAVLGEMKELGERSEKLHKMIAEVIYKNKLDLVFLGGGDTKYINDELIKLCFNPDRIFYNLQNPQISSKLLKILSRGDAVLVKGARTLLLGEVVKRLAKKKG